jgi:hypothetical protein
MLVIAGIGSRETPTHILKEMEKIGKAVRVAGGFVRSGHADGADYAFEKGAQENCIAYIPWSGFNSGLVSKAKLRLINDDAKYSAFTKKFHPNPSNLSQGAFKLMNRNVCQVLGADLDNPVDAVICWTRDGRDTGGTGQAIRIAHAYKIPVINMYYPEFNSVDKILPLLQIPVTTN